MKPSRYRPRRVALRDGREVTIRAIAESDAAEIVQAFERLSSASRYFRFMQARSEIDPAALERGVHPEPGRDFVLVATIPAPDGIDIVGAAQYVGNRADPTDTCEFALTVADDWHGASLGSRLLASLVRRARRDGYATIEGWVLYENSAMLALARRLRFEVESVPGDRGVVRVHRAL